MTADLIRKLLALNAAAADLRQWYVDRGIDPEAAEFLVVNTSTVYFSRSHQWFYKPENELCVPQSVLQQRLPSAG